MHELLNWYGSALEKIQHTKTDALHPLILAFELHWRYATIHPFYDGNGRTARIFTNLILISQGFPPAIIRQEQKEAYSKYLGDIQSGGEPDAFYAFMADLVLDAQKCILEVL